MESLCEIDAQKFNFETQNFLMLKKQEMAQVQCLSHFVSGKSLCC